MKPWTQVVSPHSDIQSGRLDESVFAADLSDVVAERGPLEYRDAATFFRRTYPTRGLAHLLAEVVGRLAGTGRGEAVIQLQTPFGGGKTHSLIALYHLIKHGREMSGSEVIADILQRAGVSATPEAAVVTFVGTAADALKGRTPWGELAGQLGRYALLQEHDQRRRAPGKDLLHQLLSTQPTLILMDEIAEYAVKARDFRDQLVAFCQELSETVKVLPQVVLVVTLPSSAPYGEEGQRALQELQQVFGRVETIKTPVEGEEIYEVIRRRLFENPGDPQQVRRTAEEFFQMYQRLGEDVPREVREPAYRDRMRKAYPFHPELIDILFERWSTFPEFQRTRGVLRLLAQVVRQLWDSRHSSPLILPAHIPLDNPAIQQELLRYIGSEYQGVIAADVAGANAKANRVDQEMESEYARLRVASGLAQAIFFASFSGSEKRGVGIQRLRLAFLQPEVPSPIVGDTLKRLEEELWYLHVENGMYRFSTQPNLNRVIVEKEEAITAEQVLAELRRRLEKLAGTEPRMIIWPKASHDIPDTHILTVAVLSPDYTRNAAETESYVCELLERCGQTFRVYRNTVIVAVADADELAAARQHIKRYLAYCAIRDDKALVRQLSEENRKGLDSKLSDLDGGMAHRLLSAYRHLAKADEHGVRWLDMGLPIVGASSVLAHRVREYLHGEDMLLSKIAPRLILEKALRPEEDEKSLSEIHEAFLRYPNLPMLENKQVLLEAIAQGVEEGTFGVRIGERVFYREKLSLSDTDASAILVRWQGVSSPSPPETTRMGGGQAAPVPVVVESDRERTPPAMGTTEPVEYYLRAAIPWDKFSEFVRGVVMPLRQDGAELKVEVILEARAEGGIKQSTLEQKVRETLRQIGATIREETITPWTPG